MRDPDTRLQDVLDAAEAIARHLDAGSLHDGLVFDAVRMRLLEIGEAVKALPATVVAREPDIAWRDVAAMRDHLAHRYFDTLHAIVEEAVREDLPPLVEAVHRLRGR